MSAEHYAEVNKVEGPFRVEFQGNVLAESDYAMELQEYHPNYEFQPVYYLPSDSLNMEHFSSNQHHTSCPIKGKASYVDLKSNSGSVENIAWTYPEPLDSVSELQDTYAFDTGKEVTIYRSGTAIAHKSIRKK